MIILAKKESFPVGFRKRRNNKMDVHLKNSKYDQAKRTGIKTFCILFFLCFNSLSYSQYFSNLFYDNRPAMLFGSIKEQEAQLLRNRSNLSTADSPYTEKALFGKN